MPKEVLNGKKMDAHPNHATCAQLRGKCSNSGSKHWQRGTGIERSDEEEGCGAKEGGGGKGKVDQGTRKYKRTNKKTSPRPNRSKSRLALQRGRRRMHAKS